MKRQTAARAVRAWAGVALVAIGTIVTAAARADDTYWKLSPPAAGDWSAPANWTASVPGASDDAFIENGGTAVISTGTVHANDVNAGFAGTGSVVHTGGYLDATWFITLGQQPTGAGLYDFSGGLITAYSISIALQGTGTFVNTGGDSRSTRLGLADAATGTGWYELSGGSVTAGIEDIGHYGKGTLVQTSGTNTADWLVIGSLSSADGTYSISGGALEADACRVAPFGKGALNITDPAARVSFSKLLSFGALSSFSAAPGATIHMTGSDFENVSASPTALAGLANLTMIFEGGAGAVDDVEVAGENRGPVAAGWVDNFSLGALQLGGADAGRIRLVDDSDNAGDGPGNEALYVGDLTINAGAAVDLNALTLYYLNGGAPKRFFNGDANLDGRVDIFDLAAVANHYEYVGMDWPRGDFNGDGVVNIYDLSALANAYGYTTGAPGAGRPVPEPATAALLALGLPVLAGRRRRKA